MTRVSIWLFRKIGSLILIVTSLSNLLHVLCFVFEQFLCLRLGKLSWNRNSLSLKSNFLCNVSIIYSSWTNWSNYKGFWTICQLVFLIKILPIKKCWLIVAFQSFRSSRREGTPGPLDGSLPQPRCPWEGSRVLHVRRNQVIFVLITSSISLLNCLLGHWLV